MVIMKSYFRVMRYIIAIGMFQALVATVLLWKNKLKNKADTLLILLLVCITAHLTIKFFIYNFVTDTHVRVQMNTFIGFCYGPLLYLYTLKQKNEAFIPIYKWYLFLPFLVAAIGYLTSASVLLVADKNAHWVLDMYNRSTYLFMASGICYGLLSLYYSKRIPEEKTKERLLIQEISWCFVLLSCISITHLIIRSKLPFDSGLLMRSVAYAILSIICIIILRFKYVGVLGMHAPQLNNFIEQPPIISIAGSNANADISILNDQDASDNDGITKRTHLSETRQQEILQQLTQHLQQTQLYTDPELSLDKLSNSANISKYYISETLNNYAQRSFYQYINELRITRMLGQMQMFVEKGLPVNILSLAYDNGFKAKSSFNLYFKKVTGHTPTEHLKTLSAKQENCEV